jgi:hypothetical protein
MTSLNVKEKLRLAFLLIAMLGTAGCGNSPEDFQKQSSVAAAANKTREAKAILQDGLVAHPGNPGLSFSLAYLYSRTEDWDELEQFLTLSQYGKSFGSQLHWSSLAFHRSESEEWESASNAYFEAAYMTIGLKQCSIKDTLIGTAGGLWLYEASADASRRIGSRHGIAKVVSALQEVAQYCTDDDLENINESIRKLSQWSNDL